MSLRTADSLSKGFENPLESHLHGVDGFFREHTTLPAPEYNALLGGIGRLSYQGGDYDLFYLRKDSVHLSVKWTLRVHLSGGTSFNLPVQNTRYYVLCKF